MQSMTINTNIYTGKVNKLSYCAFSFVTSSEKVFYVQKFPPAGGTIAPDLYKNSSLEEQSFDTINKNTFIDFWISNSSFQTNGSWKGGSWGKNNLPTTDSTWMTGVYINDKVSVTVIKNGIIKYNSGNPFTDDMPIIPGSENTAWSCNIIYNDKTYSVYLTNDIMPQKANDVLFVWENKSGKQVIKLLTRGYNENVDMPRRMMPGAGEHMEPGKDVKVKEGVLRAIKEEIGIPDSTLTDCYLLNLGTYSSEGRDPRYWLYNTDTSTFGMKRGSETNGYVIYLKSETDIAPNEVDPQDTEEVNTKWWAPIESVLIDYPDDRWMILDHKKFISDTINAIDSFKKLSPDEKEMSKFTVS
jgi:hypothetical protein